MTDFSVATAVQPRLITVSVGNLKNSNCAMAVK